MEMVHWHDDGVNPDCPCPASDLWPTEEAEVARFDAAEPAPESAPVEGA